MVKNVSIQTKLYAAFGLFWALIAGIGLLALVQSREFNDLSTQFTQEWLPEVETLGELKRAISEHRMLSERRIHTQDFRQLVTINQAQRKAAAAIEAAVQSYIATDKMNHGTALIKDFALQWKRYEEVLESVNDLFNRGEFDRGRLVFEQEVAPSFNAGARFVDQLIDIAGTQGDEATSTIEKTHTRFFWLTIAVITFAGLCAAAIFIWISRGISKPIHRVSDAMNQLSSGDDMVAIPSGNGRSDEIGKLLDAAERYRETLVLGRQLAERLNAAIHNMPLGLAMFDRGKRLIICNQLYADMYQLPEDLMQAGTPFFKILRELVQRHLFPREKVVAFAKQILSRASRYEARAHTLELMDGRTISIMMQRMPSGGWVSVHEDVTAKRQSEERVAYMARHDMLTGLPNRFHFREQTEEALKQLGPDESLAVFCLDLDRFKAVNDTLGHPVGDALLCMVAKRLRGSLRDKDIVGRLGGDEFAIVQARANQPLDAAMLSERIIKTLGEPYEIAGHQVISGTTIGIAIAPSHGVDPDQLLKNADMALYRAKQEARGTYCVFEVEMDASMQLRRRMELDLRQALAMDEFVLHYQPQLNLRTNEISGYEALIRWNHCGREIPPAEFIPLAEEIGLIIPIGQWVISQACKDAAQWLEPVNISVNLSPVQFKDPHLVQSVEDALAMSGLSPNRLELEVTETVLISDTPTVLSILHKFHELGVRISLDDFGTGYSSLSYLRSFPFDKIKIDRSFIADLGTDRNTNAIIRAVTGLAANLGIDTTAEGIETLDQLMRVRQEGCTEVQGFLIGKPKSADEMTGLTRPADPLEQEITVRSATLER